jgi:hypothetical protein
VDRTWTQSTRRRLRLVTGEGLRQVNHRVRVGFHGVGAPAPATAKLLNLAGEVGDGQAGDGGVLLTASAVGKVAEAAAAAACAKGGGTVGHNRRQVRVILGEPVDRIVAVPDVPSEYAVRLPSIRLGRVCSAADVVGTIAGDDTIFLAVKNSVAQRRVLRQVHKLSGARRRLAVSSRCKWLRNKVFALAQKSAAAAAIVVTLDESCATSQCAVGTLSPNCGRKRPS